MTNLVLLSGSLSDEYIWSRQQAALAGEYNIVCPHLHDHGSLEEMAAEALKEAPASFALAGAALGARIALEMYRIAPDRIERLALISASLNPVAEGEAEHRQEMIDKAYEVGIEKLAAAFMPRMIHASRHDDAELMAGLVAMASRFTPDGFAREAHTLLKRPDQASILGTIHCPAMVMTGSEDSLSPIERAREIAAAIPNAKLVVIEGAGHFPMLEQPEAVTAEMRRWLAAS